MGKFCPYCGVLLEEQSKFCGNCGSLLQKETQAVEPVENCTQEPSAEIVFPTEEEILPVVDSLDYEEEPSCDEPAIEEAEEILPATSEQENPEEAPEVENSDVSDFLPTGNISKKKSPIKIIALCLSILIAIALISVAIVSIPDGSSSESVNGEVSVDNPADSGKKAEDLTRTIMIYMVGSDLESRFGVGTMDVDEILASGMDTDKNKVLVYAGGTSRWHNNTLSPDENTIMLIKDDDVEILKTEKSKNMGKSSTLTEFLEYCEENYDADQYSLILWNHGAGPVNGYGLDENYDDYLTLQELVKALKASPFSKDNKLELLGFDACLMGSVETAWAFKDYAKYFVASQEIEPGCGWDYNFLGDLGKCKNGADMGEFIIDEYFNFYDEYFEENPSEETDLTLSCVNLSEIDNVTKKLENLFEKVNKEVSKGKISKVSRCRYKSKAFGKSGSTLEYDLVDLKHLTSLLSEEYSSEAKALEDALEKYVITSESNVKNANGVSVYHPYDNLYNAENAYDVFEDIDFAPKYTEYIQCFAEEFENYDAGGSSYKDFSKAIGVAEQKGQDSDLSIKLTEEQVESFSGAQYYIFKKLSDDITFSGEAEYLHIFSGQDAQLSSDGTLSATYQGKAVFGKDEKTKEYSSIPLAMYQIYDGSKEEKFYFPCMFYSFGEDGLDFNVEPVNWLMKINDEKPKLLNAYSIDAEKDDMFPDKFLINNNMYDIYGFVNNSYTVNQNQAGNIELTFTGNSYGFEYTKENGFSIELRPIDYNDEYYAMFVVEDIYGNSYTSDFFPLGK